MKTPRRIQFGTAKDVPNSKLPVLLFRRVLAARASDKGRRFRQLFQQNGWTGLWTDTIYDYTHFHSNAHEVLGIAAGSARVRLGGEQGQTVELFAGDIVVIPAGVAHKRESASADLLVIGAYPKGQHPDICRAEPGARGKALGNIAAVPLPAADPVTGGAEPLLACWRETR